MSDVAVTTTNYENDIPGVPRFRTVLSSEFGERPPVSWLVKSILPSTGIGSIYGQSGSGKSFLTVDLSCSLASEGRRTFFGHKIRKSVPVIYIALEAEGGIPGRIRAWCLKNDRPTPEGLRLLEITDGKPFQLADAEDMRALGLQVLEDVGPGAGVMIDTLAMAAGGLDENSATDMSSAIMGAKALQVACAGLVLLVHHTGKDANKGMRGSSALQAACDFVIEVTRNGDARGWKLAKSKEGRDGITAAFTLCDVPLGRFDEDGDELSSVAVVWDQAARVAPVRVRAPTGKNQVLVLSEITARLSNDDPTPLSYASALSLGVFALSEEAKPKAGASPAELKKAARHRMDAVKDAMEGLFHGRYLLRGGNLAAVSWTVSLPGKPAG